MTLLTKGLGTKAVELSGHRAPDDVAYRRGGALIFLSPVPPIVLPVIERIQAGTNGGRASEQTAPPAAYVTGLACFLADSVGYCDSVEPSCS